MNTPVITKGQQKQTLASGKKSGKKTSAKGVRNVLAQPYDRYWPVVDTGDETSLEKLLDKLLPGLKRQSQSIPWALLRKMNGEERLAAQKKARSDAESNSTNTELLKSVVMGVNAVTRELESKKLCSILLDSTVESLLIKHVITMAQNQNIPILLIPSLKKATLEHIKFASAAMGLRNSIIETAHPLHELHQEIVKLSEAIPSPKTEILPAGPKIASRFAAKEILQIENTPANPPFTSSTSIYKFRSSRKERSFVPPNTEEKLIDNKNEWSDFIALGKDEPIIQTAKSFCSRKNKNWRYVDIHAKTSNETPKNIPESEEFIRFDSKDEEFIGVDSKNEEFIGFDSKNEEFTGFDNKNEEFIGFDTKDEEKSKKPEKRKLEKNTYVPLKVKRIQGNNNRVKATKTPKQKKKGK